MNDIETEEEWFMKLAGYLFFALVGLFLAVLGVVAIIAGRGLNSKDRNMLA